MGLISKENSKSRNRLNEIYPRYIDTTNPKYMIINNMYISSFIVVDYNKEMAGGFLNKLLSLGIDFTISMFYEKQNSNEIIKKLTYQLGNTGSDIKDSKENQMDMDVMTKAYDDTRYIRRQMQLENEEFYYLYIYISVYSNSIKKLEINKNKIQNIAICNGLTVLNALFKEEKCFMTSLPILNNDKLIKRIAKRNVLTDGISSTYPFLSNELCDKDGVLLGVNAFNNSLVMIDRFNSEKYKNANMFVLGTSGSGKSYFSKLMIARNRYFNIAQYIVDPDREYSKLCEKLDGTLIDFKKFTINVMDIRKTTSETQMGYLENKIGKLKGFFSIIFSNMSEEEKSFLDEKIIECYESKGITFDDDSLYKNKNGGRCFKDSSEMPKLEDLYKLLVKAKRLRRLATLLKPYVQGSMKFLNNYTNVDLSNKVVVSDVYDIEEKDLTTIMYIITEFYWDKIKENRGEKKILYLDEAWRLINNNRETAQFVFKVFKTIRKYGGAATAITQDVNDFFTLDEGIYGKGILNNSSIKCIFQLEEGDVTSLEKVINFSENEKYRFTNLKRGTCIMIAGEEHLALQVEASKMEHTFITTDRKDLSEY